MCTLDTNSTLLSKTQLREKIIKNLKEFTKKEEESEHLLFLLEKSIDFSSFDAILAYYPILSTEPNIIPFITKKNVLLPYIEKGEMRFSKSKILRKTKYGFYEPEKIEEKYSYALMLVPLLGVTKEGFRLGRGGGFYDKYIKENRKRLYTIGLAFTPSLLEKIPTEEHDQRLDRVIFIQ